MSTLPHKKYFMVDKIDELVQQLCNIFVAKDATKILVPNVFLNPEVDRR